MAAIESPRVIPVFRNFYNPVGLELRIREMGEMGFPARLFGLVSPAHPKIELRYDGKVGRKR